MLLLFFSYVKALSSKQMREVRKKIEKRTATIEVNERRRRAIDTLKTAYQVSD